MIVSPSARFASMLLASALLYAAPAFAHPGLFHWMEELEPEEVRLVADFDASPATLRIELPERALVIDLAEVRLGRSASARSLAPGGTAEPVLYRGTVRSVEGSVVAVSIVSDRLTASVRMEGELLLIESARPSPSAAGVVYRDRDPFAGPSRLRPAPDSAGRMVLGGGSPTFVLQVAAVADFEFFQKFGGGSEAQMLAVLNLVDAIYLDQIDVTFDVSFSEVFDEMNDPFTDFNSANLFNNYRDAALEFGAWRDDTGGAVESAGLAHLFSDRNLNVPAGGKINAGFGFIDVLCDADRGVSISTAPTVGTSLHAVVVAHEFGHNFGAPHDSEGACAATPAGQFLMSPSATGNSFSDCSRNIMTASRDDAPCIDEVATTTTTTTLPEVICGDMTGDGKLLASDALQVLRAGVGQFVCLLCMCDVDDSGGASASDALRVLRASVGQPVELNCPACN